MPPNFLLKNLHQSKSVHYPALKNTAVKKQKWVQNSEFSGRPEQPERSEAQFWKSMDVIIPRIEKEGILLNIEPHPDDFIEDGIRGVDMVRAINSRNVGFLYCATHTFHQGGNMREIMEKCAEAAQSPESSGSRES